MRIHTNATLEQMRAAVQASGAHAEVLERHGSRKRDHAWEVKLTGASRRRPNFYDGSGAYAATWDQWGVFIAAVFDADPDATMTYYADRGDFLLKTDWRFTGGTPDDAHGDHTFRFSGTPREQNCTKCSAVQRW